MSKQAFNRHQFGWRVRQAALKQALGEAICAGTLGLGFRFSQVRFDAIRVKGRMLDRADQQGGRDGPIRRPEPRGNLACQVCRFGEAECSEQLAMRTFRPVCTEESGRFHRISFGPLQKKTPPRQGQAEGLQGPDVARPPEGSPNRGHATRCWNTNVQNECDFEILHPLLERLIREPPRQRQDSKKACGRNQLLTVRVRGKFAQRLQELAGGRAITLHPPLKGCFSRLLDQALIQCRIPWLPKVWWLVGHSRFDHRTVFKGMQLFQRQKDAPLPCVAVSETRVPSLHELQPFSAEPGTAREESIGGKLSARCWPEDLHGLPFSVSAQLGLKRRPRQRAGRRW